MKKILVKDDDAAIREVLSHLLELCGYEVQTLSSGEKVFETLKHYKADLILMDIMLGDMDGREICKSLKSNAVTARIPIVLMSATEDPGNLNGINGPNDFLAKPFELNRLLDSVSRPGENT